jgi:hypothetical protein
VRISVSCRQTNIRRSETERRPNRMTQIVRFQGTSNPNGHRQGEDHCLPIIILLYIHLAIFYEDDMSPFLLRFFNIHFLSLKLSSVVNVYVKIIYGETFLLSNNHQRCAICVPGPTKMTKFCIQQNRKIKKFSRFTL